MPFLFNTCAAIRFHAFSFSYLELLPFTLVNQVNFVDFPKNITKKNTQILYVEVRMHVSKADCYKLLCPNYLEMN